MHEKDVKKYFAALFLIILAVFLGYALIKYVSAVFGALVLFYLFHWLYKFFVKKTKLGKPVSAILVIIVTLIIIIMPIYFFINATYNEVNQVYQNREKFVEDIEKLDFINSKGWVTEVSLQIGNFGSYIQNWAIKTLQSVAHLVISMTIMYFILYYLFIHSDEVDKRLANLIPFNLKNSKRLIKEFRNVTYSTVITSGLIAVIQGGMITIGFLVFGLKGALFWGLIGALLSFLPVVGAPLIWIPAAIILFLRGNPTFGVGMIIWGLILSNIDNIIRPNLQRKIGRIHPLITLLGIFIGIPFFGLFGVIIGPLLLSYFLLSFNMFREEYLDHDVKINVFAKETKRKNILMQLSKKSVKKS